MSFKVSAAARSDLRDIYLYSLHNFDEVTADRYLDALYLVFQTIGQNREIGLKPDFEIQGDVRKFPALNHVIYYRVGSNTVEIRRVFHSSREVGELDIRPFQ